MTDLRQSPQYADYLSSLGWVVERTSNANYFIRKFALLGSFLKIQRPDKIDFDEIEKLAKKNHAFQTVIEPSTPDNQTLITNHGFKQSKTYFVPSKTIQIDLTKSEKQLLKEMHHKTRYNIKIAKKNKIKIITSSNIKKFADFWQECALHQRGMIIPQKKEIKEIYKAFGNRANIIFALHSNELLSGILLLHSDKVSYYMYAASSSYGKKLFAPTLAAWEAIKLSKKNGAKIFDFEGIYDDRFPLKSWIGFSRFKKSFGGKEIEYPGTFTKFRFPL
jgi:lipid II:glycine glycyltransferase (peptidoglycan interpeptide bridge formation enzyme)